MSQKITLDHDYYCIQIHSGDEVKTLGFGEILTFEIFLEYLKNREDSTLKRYWKLRSDDYEEDCKLGIYTFTGNIECAILKGMETSSCVLIDGWEYLEERIQEIIPKLIEGFFATDINKEHHTLEYLQEYLVDKIIAITTSRTEMLWLQKSDSPILC